MKTVLFAIVLDRKPETVSHEIDIPFNRAHGDFKPGSHARAIRILPALEPFIHFQHPLPGSTVESAERDFTCVWLVIG